MRNNMLHTPEGVRDLLPLDCSYKIKIERNIENVFHRYGYNNIETPTFEYSEVFTTKAGGILPEHMYKFFDRDGSTLSLKIDMTLPIARVVGTSYRKEELPLRFCYLGNAFRNNDTYQGKMREFSQAGIELIGDNSENSDAEVIAVAVNAILNTGLSDFKVDIGQVDFLRGIIQEAQLNNEESLKIQTILAQKDYIALDEALKKIKMSDNIKKVFSDIYKWVGKLDMLAEVKKLITNETAIKAIEKMESLYDIFTEYGVEKYIYFDLGMITHLNYYTGIIFRGYTHGTGFSILDGGRYDKLIKEFGMDTPAVGFAIRINEILLAIERQKITVAIDKADTLAVYTKQGRKSALKTLQELRKTGAYIENGFVIEDLDKALEYAKTKSFDGVLFFEDDKNVEVINIATGQRNRTLSESIINKQQGRE